MASISSEGSETVSLNIMPMLDIFSILILFLLMNFSTDPVSHDLTEGIDLPESATIQSLDEVPAVVVTKTKLLVNDKPIADVVDGDVRAGDRAQGAIFPLFNELTKMREANVALLKKLGKDSSTPGLLTLEMDKSHRFKLMKRVMLSAEQADFVRFKLMVSKELN